MRYSTLEDIDDHPDVNLTPLIDIVFVILMAFMISMPLIRLDTIALAPGSSEKTALNKEESSPITIKVFADQTITLNECPLTMQELQKQLLLLYARNPKNIPLLLQDGDTPFKLYQEVKTSIESAGFHELHIALKS